MHYLRWILEKYIKLIQPFATVLATKNLRNLLNLISTLTFWLSVFIKSHIFNSSIKFVISLLELGRLRSDCRERRCSSETSMVWTARVDAERTQTRRLWRSFDQLLGRGRCHVHFHSIEVARFLFARWRVWAHWTRAIRVTRLVPFASWSCRWSNL